MVLCALRPKMASRVQASRPAVAIRDYHLFFGNISIFTSDGALVLMADSLFPRELSMIKER